MEKMKTSYRNVEKSARKAYSGVNISLIGFLVVFGLFRDLIFVPLLGKLWGLVLKTTPDGFISNSNIASTLLKSPWIIPAGLILVCLYLILLMWQVCAIITAVGYIHSGKKIRLSDLLVISLKEIKRSLKVRNLMLPVYVLVVIPFSNVYQINDAISSFVIPEYISEFINANAILTAVLAALTVFVVYISLRWFFILPSFFFKKENFSEARRESVVLVKGGLVKNGLSLIWYSLVELIRLSIIPIVLMLVPSLIAFLFTSKLAFAENLYRYIIINNGLELIKSLTGTLTQISILCYVVKLYFAKLEEKGLGTETTLPENIAESRNNISIRKVETLAALGITVILLVVYVVVVLVAQSDSDVILKFFGQTEVIAHKGYASKAPENTMPAFALADNCEEVSYIELDVWTSKDGIPVVVHNETITAATGVEKYIYDCTYEELQTIPATYTYSVSEFADARIPSLEEVLAAYSQSTPILIEIKGTKKDPDLPAKVVALMEKYNCVETSAVQSGDYKTLEAVKQSDPNVRCGLILAMVTGNYFDLPYADFFSVEHTFINSRIIRQIHLRNKKIYAWTINFEDSADKLKLSGIDGIITDYPETMSKYFDSSNSLFYSATINRIGEQFKNHFEGQIYSLFDSTDARKAVSEYMNGSY